MARRKKRKRVRRRCLWGIALLAVAYVSLFVCYPRVCRYVVAHKAHNVPVGTYNQEFADMNDVQLRAARSCGVPPVEDRGYDFGANALLVPIASCDAYRVEALTHSVPYLTAGASNLLKEIGAAYQERIRERGLAKNRVVVTSVLRTLEDVQKLRRVNGNASDNSAHCYGTTFDLSYNRFSSTGLIIYDVYEDAYVEALAEVLREKRRAGECYVRFETQQHCFHITSRR